MMRRVIFMIVIIASLMNSLSSKAQQSDAATTFIDNNGIWRWKKDRSQVYLFGVNYTAPFAYAYRAMKAQHLDPKKAIDADIYHIARMGADAFRVHIWDTEISDSTGNLLQNEHLELFDYLLYRLKQRNIKIIITPIAFWGNGYPDKDEITLGFSHKYGKGRATVVEGAIKAQERYLNQLLRHVNPYTKQSYADDPDIIAAELNNEPSHSGPKNGVTAYINRLVKAAREAGWTKPLFYNISQNPWYADAVAKSDVQGFSFQWYPTGLVAGQEQQGNFIPNIDRYNIPFDTIPEFRNKARMVYEFDAADLLQSCIYPMIAKSFRQAGFQWATQFAYDPMATAFANTEYQTHFLNLAYTPAKAISFLIANRVFHNLPANSNWGKYPTDSVFSSYHVSYREQLSEMNTEKEFYYSGSTTTAPIKSSSLVHIAGVGSSPVISYQGFGAYFVDKLEDGLWRLEVMPDAVTIRDPFHSPSPEREVVHIQWENQHMSIKLKDLGDNFMIKGINEGNNYVTNTTNGSFIIRPGTYLISKHGKSTGKWNKESFIGNLQLKEFVAPLGKAGIPYVTVSIKGEIGAGKPLTIIARVVNTNAADTVKLHLQNMHHPLLMKRVNPYEYACTLTTDQFKPGLLRYRITIVKEGKYFTFPGAHEGNPGKWDYINDDYWQLIVPDSASNIALFTADHGDQHLNVLLGSGRRAVKFAPGETDESLAFSLPVSKGNKSNLVCMELYVGDKLHQRQSELSGFNKIVVRARQIGNQQENIRLSLIDQNGHCFGAPLNLSSEYQDIELPFSTLQEQSSVLLPRPYPSFQELMFRPEKAGQFNLQHIDKLQLTTEANTEGSIEIEHIFLKK